MSKHMLIQKKLQNAFFKIEKHSDRLFYSISELKMIVEKNNLSSSQKLLVSKLIDKFCELYDFKEQVEKELLVK